MVRKIKLSFFKEVWRLTRDYWRSSEKWLAGGLLATIVALNLGDVYLLVRLNEWNNGFYNALQHYNQKVFFSALGTFTILAAIYIVIAVYELYFQQMLEIRWRRWMTEHYLQNWLQRQNYYRLQLTGNSADNPDQRISEDIKLFVSATLTLSLGILKALVTLFSFTVILWNLSGTLTIPWVHGKLAIPGYMVWMALAYAIVGTWLTAKIGRPLVKLNFDQQRYEADFRFSLVRLRENSESVAFYQGEAQERQNFSGRFKKAFENFYQLMKQQKRLTWFTAGYDQIAIIFPFLVAAPRFFSHQIQLGGLVQTASAFGRVQDSLSYFVDSYASIAEWQAVVERLVGFNRQIEFVSESPDLTTVQFGAAKEPRFDVTGLKVALPGGEVLFEDLQFQLDKGDSLLITGPSGAGKSTLMRTFAGIWPFAQGQISLPQGEKVLFLPQKPYLPLGTLREVLLYPSGTGSIPDATIKEVMSRCRLDELINELDTIENWSHVLSLGEQQRIAFSRALLHRPQWLFLDEATSALDEPLEQLMYKLLQEELPDLTIISVGHRQTLTAFHRRRLHIDNDGRVKLLLCAAGLAADADNGAQAQLTGDRRELVLQPGH